MQRRVRWRREPWTALSDLEKMLLLLWEFFVDGDQGFSSHHTKQWFERTSKTQALMDQ